MRRIEVHVRRNMESRTRPEIVPWDGYRPRLVLLHTGSGDGSGRVSVGLSSLIPIDRFWASGLFTVSIDDVRLSSPRPGVVFLELSDIPTLVHFPSLGRPDDPVFGGWWTVALRVVET